MVRTIDAMITNQFDEHFKNSIKKDFEVGGIEEVLNKFIRFNELILGQRTELLLQLEKVENNLADQFKLRNDIKEILNSSHNKTLKTIMKISELKETFIYNIEMREKIEQNGYKISGLSKNTLSDLNELINKIEKMNKYVKENIKIINQEVLKFKNKGKITNEIIRQKEVDSFVDNFTNTLVNIETTISKIELIFKGANEQNIDDYKERLIFSRNILAKQTSEFKDITARITEFDEKMVKTLKIIYETQKESEDSLKNLGILVVEGYRETDFNSTIISSKEMN
jgi:hypothetical protein